MAPRSSEISSAGTRRVVACTRRLARLSHAVNCTLKSPTSLKRRPRRNEATGCRHRAGRSGFQGRRAAATRSCSQAAMTMAGHVPLSMDHFFVERGAGIAVIPEDPIACPGTASSW